MGELDNLSDGKAEFGVSRYVTDTHHSRSFIQQGPELLEKLRVVLGDVGEAQLDPVTASDVVPGNQVTRVFLIAQDHVVSGFPIEAVGNHVDPHRGVFPEHDLG